MNYSTGRLDISEFEAKFITSALDSTWRKTPFTEKQVAIIKRIARAHRREIEALGELLPDDLDTLVCSNGVRKLNYNRALWFDGNKIMCKFPYNEEQVELFRQATKVQQGIVAWDSNATAWKLSLTEFNVSWVVEFAKAHKFEIDPDLLDIADKIKQIEQTDYKIELVVDDAGKFTVTNAARSLLSEIDTHLQNNDVRALVDCSSMYGYSVSPGVLALLGPPLTDTFLDLCTKNSAYVSPYKYNRADAIAQILVYAEVVDRFPVVIYNPLSKTDDDINQLLAQQYGSEYQYVKDEHTIPVDVPTKVYYTNNIGYMPDRKALLVVCSLSSMFGLKRKYYGSQFEKVVYYAEETNVPPSKNSFI